MKNSTLLKKAIALAAIIVMITTGCKRTEIPVTPDPIPTNNAGGVVDDLAQVTASVSGIVLDESNTPIANAVVTSGVGTTTTNSNGMFILNNISLSKENGNVTVVKAGYFKGIRSFKTTAGKNHSVRLQLMAKTLSGTVNATNGGTINANGGATIIFPAVAFVTSAGAAYTGTVNVYSRWIDPTAANLPFIIPGDLRGVGTNGVENILETYGMVGAELEDGAGNALKIATGKKATISFPIPASLTATAPASIVLWHFDEATARWKENGTGIKSGNNYTAQVDKFSFWNWDLPLNFVLVDYTLINSTTNTPIVYASTRIKKVSNGTNTGYKFNLTNNTGFAIGGVPINELLVLELLSGCGTVVYTKIIGPFTTNASLGNISATISTSQYINFTGSLLNCTGMPVTNGYVSFYATGGYNAIVNSNSIGEFSFSILSNCGSSLAYSFLGFDKTTMQESQVLNGNIINGLINFGNISVCTTSANVDIYVAGNEYTSLVGGFSVAKVWKNGIATNLTNGLTDASANSVFVSGSDVYVAGYENNVAGTSTIAKLWKNGVGINLSLGNNFARANSVFVSGSDVYVAGFESDATGTHVAKIWKNGIPSNLNSTGNLNAYAMSIYVSGVDVYVAGYAGSGNSPLIAKVWKNGNETSLNNASQSFIASSIFVSGTDVYVAGGSTNSVQGERALVWKNNVLTNLTDGSRQASAYSVYVSGNDVYVSGYERNISGTSLGNAIPKIWKNGSPIILPDASPNFIGAYAYSAFVFGNVFYVVGFGSATFTSLKAKVWRNGIMTNLTDGSTEATAKSVFVK
jgi:hypothetical protein